MPLKGDAPPSRAPRATPPLQGEDGCNPSLSVVPAKAGTQLSTWSARPMTSSTSDHVLPSTVVIPAKTGISLLLTKRRKQKRDPSFRWDDGGNPTVRYLTPPIALSGADLRLICATAAHPVSAENADRAKSTNSGRKTLILPWQGRWLAEGQTEGCPAIVRVTPLRPALRARHLPFQGRMAENHHSRHSREGGYPTLYRVGARTFERRIRPH